MYGLDNLPFGAAEGRLWVRYGDGALDLSAAAARGAVDERLAASTLNPFLAGGRPLWTSTRAALRKLEFTNLTPVDELSMTLPFEVADYVDFYSSEQHAINASRILRPNSPGITPNWKHLPIGYHGRSGSVVVSGTDIVRPHGQWRDPDGVPEYGPTRRLDVECEVGFVVGVPSDGPVPTAAFREHVFGVVLLNDWSARDIQAWEMAPLGPFLGKSFATSISPWVVPLDALEAARITAPAQDPPVLPYLRDDRTGYDLRLTLEVNGTVLTRPPFHQMYWTAAQQLAHMTVNGANVRTGDLYASGTVSGSDPDELGCLLELYRNTRYLADGDTVTISATAPGPDGSVIGLGEVSGTIRPAR
ncbi:fumarylacetoacetase [Virgisporangium aliadipatigenens]|uniref:fumarylacetoacetase n=1 Tax=Virgisporangium aliadipatigenens TaxID=741659 RepID=A0A8J3YX52_9ACTN|nr:fumarylacetoacetate hydrolase family protein [Virgisporangium aliadipatigenens]GIJ51263.1 fumarylacetoacetase [Virgisporangium aliadipatigenens]